MRRFIALFVILAAAVTSLTAQADTYPSKPLRLIVPFPPGGAVDILGRAIAARLAEQLGQAVVVDNRAGAGGALGSEAAARAAPDGYTLLIGSTTTMSINPFLYTKLSYNPSRDFAPISQLAFVPHLLVVGPAVPAATLKDFLTHARANPGKLNYASAGNGTPHHIAGELFKQINGIDMVHVPYKGTGPAVIDLIGGQVSFMSVEMLAALPMVTAGKLKALAIATPQRNPQAPDIPTAAEAGVPGFEVTSWYGVVAPSATPPEIIARLGAEIARAVKSADFQERLTALGATPVGSDPQAFAAFLKRENDKWARAVKASGAQID